MLLGCRLMVGQEILVLFIMVRIRAPQPINSTHQLVGFIYWRCARIVQIRFTFARQNIINVLYAFCSKMLVGTSPLPCVCPNQDKQHRSSGRFFFVFPSISPSSKTSRRDKYSAVEPSRFPRRRQPRESPVFKMAKFRGTFELLY